MNSSISRGSTYSVVVGLVAVLALAATLRLIGLGEESFWFDEGYTVAFVSLPFIKMLKCMPAHEPHPPLYFIIMKLWSYLGVSEVLLRFPSVICGVVTVWVLWLLVRENWGTTPAFAAALLCATSGITIWYSQEARMYSLVLLLAAFSMKYFLRFLSPSRPPEKSDSAGLVVITAALVYTHNVAVLLLAAQVLFMCAWGAVNRKNPGPVARFKKWGLSQCALLITLVPWVSLFVIQRGYVQSGFWIPRPTLRMLMDYIRYLLVFESEGISFRMLAPLAVVCAVTILSMLRDARVAATLTCFVVPVMACYFYSRIYNPIMIPRVLLYVTVPLFTLIGLMLYQGEHSARPGYWIRCRQIVGAILITALVVCNLHCWYHEKERVSKDEFRRAASIASTLIGPESAIVFPNAGSQPAFDYYFHGHPLHDRVLEVPLPMHYLDIPGGSCNLEPPVTPESVARLNGLLGGRNKALLVMSHVRGTDPQGMVKRYFEEHWHFSKKIDLVEITLLLYER